MRHRSLVFGLTVVLPRPTLQDRGADADRLTAELEKHGFHPLHVPLDIIQRLPHEMRKNDFTLDLVMGCTDVGYVVLDINSSNPVYGIALDIGTTTIECALFDLNAKKKIAALEAANPQAGYGADVLARAQMAMGGEGDDLVQVLREGINRLIRAVCNKCCVDLQNVYALTVAGNTIMSHFFLGLEVSNIPIAPNTPAVGHAVFCSSRDVDISLHPKALVYVFPNAGSYVGGDIISGMIAIGILEQPAPVLFLDVGTNVEITLGCKEWIMVGAGAAGPALEGGIAGIGRRAEPGTISRVAIDSQTGETCLTVISGDEPKGICGSGLIDLVSELFAKGFIDRAGRFNLSRKGVVLKDGVASYQVFRSPGKELLLTEHELQNFLRSKAAMFAFLFVFLKSVDMRISDIDKIYVAGALGCGINLESAVTIGMLPDIKQEKMVPIGNSSLRGASMLLLNSSLLDDVRHIRALITYRQMSEDPDLLNALQGALFIPHTDPELLKG
jgi:uncharacterized 2Fe-2S/4Fe-4S cluster protein (DUF4445 family)